MVKIKTSSKRKTSLKNIPMILELKSTNSVSEFSPTKELLNENFIGKAILECLKNNDPEGVMEVVSIYLDTLNKTKHASIADIPRSTLYHSLKHKNPTIKTLSKLISAANIEVKKQ